MWFSRRHWIWWKNMFWGITCTKLESLMVNMIQMTWNRIARLTLMVEQPKSRLCWTKWKSLKVVKKTVTTIWQSAITGFRFSSVSMSWEWAQTSVCFSPLHDRTWHQKQSWNRKLASRIAELGYLNPSQKHPPDRTTILKQCNSFQML